MKNLEFTADKEQGTVKVQISEMFKNFLHDKAHTVTVTFDDGEEYDVEICENRNIKEWLSDNIGIESTKEQVSSFSDLLDF